MLIEFSVSNFLSFKEHATLSMETGRALKKHRKNTFDKNGTKLLKNALLFGANGSGKSNFLVAMNTFRKMVVEPTSDIEKSLAYMPFMLDDYSDNIPTHFSITFIVNDQKYRYELDYMEKEIVKESLIEWDKKGEEKTYFIRGKATDNEILPELLKIVRPSVRPNKLLLYVGQQHNDPRCIDVFKWFNSALIFESNRTNKQLFTTLINNPEKKAMFIDLIKSVDIDALDIIVQEVIEEIPEPLSKWLDFQDNKIKNIEVFIKHPTFDEKGQLIYGDDGNPQTTLISYEMESTGTRKLMVFLLMVLNSIGKDQVIIMDEFDDSFHLSLTLAILNLVNSEYNNNQFIFTTHTLNLLDADLRVDQIYFTEKRFTGETELFSLFDFNDLKAIPRSDVTFFRRYLKGRFGALPALDENTLVKFFKES